MTGFAFNLLGSATTVNHEISDVYCADKYVFYSCLRGKIELGIPPRQPQNGCYRVFLNSRSRKIQSVAFDSFLFVLARFLAYK